MTNPPETVEELWYAIAPVLTDLLARVTHLEAQMSMLTPKPVQPVSIAPFTPVWESRPRRSHFIPNYGSEGDY